MDDKRKIILEFRNAVNKLVNQYNRLDRIPFEIGDGELLYQAEMHAIEAVGKGICSTVTQLCAYFGVTKGAVSQIVTKLCAKGYVKKERSPVCGKEVELSLTDKGTDIFVRHEKLHEKMDKELESYLDLYSADSVDEFKKMLTHITKHIDKYINLDTKKI